jgi:arylsulfatase A-like enzyme
MKSQLQSAFVGAQVAHSTFLLTGRCIALLQNIRKEFIFAGRLCKARQIARFYHRLMRFPTRFPIALLLTVALSAALSPVRLAAQVFAGKPKLIVIIVIDQFRGDYLQRHRTEFKGGFNLLMTKGAWFTDCYYDYANTETAPGHSTIGTGAYSDGHGIDGNEFWDLSRNSERKVTAVEDERYQLVDLPDASIPAKSPGATSSALSYVVGASPRNLRASTLGDELRLATQGKARVYGVSLKDRAAILTVGQSANAAYWIDKTSGQFTTSTYYMEHLPSWVAAFNTSSRIAQATLEAGLEKTHLFYDLVGHTPAANRYEFDFAKALIQNEKLGQNGVTDLLVVSLSANDIMGHQFGPDSAQEDESILTLDKDLGDFYQWLDMEVGLKYTWLALTADHGISSIPAESSKLGMNAALLDLTKVYDEIDRGLNKRFSPAQKLEFLMPKPDIPYITLDRRVFEKLKIDEKSAEEEVAKLLSVAVAKQIPEAPKAPSQTRLDPTPLLTGVYTATQIAHGELPQTELSKIISHSYVDHGNWFVMYTLSAYQQPDFRVDANTSHFAPWSYDRHVPLAFYGEVFQPGEYHSHVAPVDLAATLASLAGVNQPSASVGRVLTDALKPSLAHE